MATVKLLWVYGDRDDTPLVVLDAPPNFAALLREWNALDRRLCNDEDVPDWLPVGEWLSGRGVKFCTAEEVMLDVYHSTSDEPPGGASPFTDSALLV